MPIDPASELEDPDPKVPAAHIKSLRLSSVLLLSTGVRNPRQKPRCPSFRCDRNGTRSGFRPVTTAETGY